MTIVLTPTISLMKDQCRKLEEKGISDTYLGSSQTDLHIVDKMKRRETIVLSMSLQKKILIAAKKSQALCSKNC